MSIEALRAVFRTPMHDAAAKAVLVALADHANAQWTCWPSIRRLCLFTALSERTVRRALRRLTEMGAIRVVARHGQTGLVTLAPSWLEQPRQEMHPGTSCTPAADAGVPRSPMHPTPVTVTGTPVAVAP